MYLIDIIDQADALMRGLGQRRGQRAAAPEPHHAHPWDWPADPSHGADSALRVVRTLPRNAMDCGSSRATRLGDPGQYKVRARGSAAPVANSGLRAEIILTLSLWDGRDAADACACRSRSPVLRRWPSPRGPVSS